jgi:hypothetical protein
MAGMAIRSRTAARPAEKIVASKIRLRIHAENGGTP